jgi:hypothetical protein
MARDYRSQLDGLRAIAIGLVGIEHFGGPWIREHFPIGAGPLGVHLFFVLSGFLITRNLRLRLEQAPAEEVIRGFDPWSCSCWAYPRSVISFFGISPIRATISPPLEVHS